MNTLEQLTSALQKLKIEVYATYQRNKKAGEFTAMFNPETITRTQQIVYDDYIGIKANERESNYVTSKSGGLSLQLTLDGMPPTPNQVAEQIQALIDLTTKNNPAHVPKYLRLKWGTLSYPCFLSNLVVSYTSFDRHGNPQRAVLDLQFIYDPSGEAEAATSQQTDNSVLQKTVAIKAGDTLPILAKQHYGSEDAYLLLAKANDLDDFRQLTPGMKLHIPTKEELNAANLFGALPL